MMLSRLRLLPVLTLALLCVLTSTSSLIASAEEEGEGVSADTIKTAPATLCEALDELSLPSTGTDVVTSSKLAKLHKSLKASAFNNVVGLSRALSPPDSIGRITPTFCSNFGKLCPVGFVAWLLDNPNTVATLGDEETKNIWVASLMSYIQESIPSGLIQTSTLQISDILRCAAGGSSTEPTPSSVYAASLASQHDDLHDRALRDTSIEAIKQLRGRLVELSRSADRGSGMGFDLLGASPPATLPRFLPAAHLHRLADVLAYIDQFRDIAIFVVVSASVMCWCATWVCFGGTRSLWAWVRSHRNSKDIGDRMNMISTAIRWQRLNVLGVVYRAHMVSCLVPVAYCGFVAYYLSDVFGIGPILSAILSPAASPLLSLIVAVVGGASLGGGFLLMLFKDANKAWADYRTLCDTIESTDAPPS